MRSFRMMLTVVLSSLSLLTMEAQAQATFGEYLDRGATKVLKAEWLSILPASISASSAGGGHASLRFSPDGKLTGEFFSKEGNKSPITGTWTMDDGGRRCIDEYFTAWNRTHKECSYMYKMNGNYYGTTTDSDRSARQRNPPVAYKIKVQ